jgi:hypothetical protein
MRTSCYQAVIGLIVLTLSTIASAELIYGFNNVKVTKRFTTLVEFDQADFKEYQKADHLKLRVIDGGKVIREDGILNTEGVWSWDKILPFSEHLKFLILKDDKPISTEYLADTKSSLAFSASDALPMIRGVHSLPAIQNSNNKKIRLPIVLPKELKNCKDKILAIVFNKETNTLLWQYYGEAKYDLKTDEVDYSENLQSGIITDDGSCTK